MVLVYNLAIILGRIMQNNDNIFDYIDHKNNILISENELQEGLKDLALKISLDYRDKHIVLIGVLKGAAMFMMDLSRYIIVPLIYDFISVSNNEGNNSTGTAIISRDITEKIKNKHVIIVDDICDTGCTLNHVCMNLLLHKPASLKICVLLNKKTQKKENVKIDFKGFDIEDKFVVGYGLDYNGKYRNLPFICTIEE